MASRYEITIDVACNGYYVEVTHFPDGPEPEYKVTGHYLKPVTETRQFIAAAPQALADQIAKLLQRVDPRVPSFGVAVPEQFREAAQALVPIENIVGIPAHEKEYQ